MENEQVPAATTPPMRPKVLLVAGASGVGKTTLALELARRHGVSWVQVDDLRLAFEASPITFHDEATNRAFDLLRTFAYPPEWCTDDLRDWLIDIGRAMGDAIAIVAGNHVVQNNPAVMEGDAILPELREHPRLQPHFASGDLQMVVISPESETALLEARKARGRGGDAESDASHQHAAARNWAFAQWLAAEAAAHEVPVIAASPIESLIDRVEPFSPRDT